MSDITFSCLSGSQHVTFENSYGRTRVTCPTLLALMAAMLVGDWCRAQSPFTVFPSVTNDQLEVRFGIPPLHYAYAGKLFIRVGGEPRWLRLPTPKVMPDKFSGEAMKVFSQPFEAHVYPLRLGVQPLTVQVGLQGCNDTECYLPETRTFCLSPEGEVTEVINLGGPRAIAYQLLYQQITRTNPSPPLPFPLLSPRAREAQYRTNRLVCERYDAQVALAVARIDYATVTREVRSSRAEGWLAGNAAHAPGLAGILVPLAEATLNYKINYKNVAGILVLLPEATPYSTNATSGSEMIVESEVPLSRAEGWLAWDVACATELTDILATSRPLEKLKDYDRSSMPRWNPSLSELYEAWLVYDEVRGRYDAAARELQATKAAAPIVIVETHYGKTTDTTPLGKFWPTGPPKTTLEFAPSWRPKIDNLERSVNALEPERKSAADRVKRALPSVEYQVSLASRLVEARIALKQANARVHAIFLAAQQATPATNQPSTSVDK